MSTFSELEIDITQYDIVSMELIYHENVHKLENNLLFPHTPDLRSLLSQRDSVTNFTPVMSVFLQRLRQKKLRY